MEETERLEVLRLDGGLLGALRAALGGWWREVFVLTALNLLWVIAFFSVILMPPATAAMFYVARRVLAGDPFVGWHSFAEPIRRHWRAALRWGLIVFLVGGVAAANLWLYRDAPGWGWRTMRWVWATILVLWLALNLFFWPFWFAEDGAHRTLRVTWRNAAAFLATHPLPALLVTVLVLLLGGASVVLGAPLGLLFMAWTALLATATLAAHLPREMPQE